MPTLGDYCAIKLNSPEADFWMHPSGSKLGEVTETFAPDLIGIKVTDTKTFYPKYLFYWFQHLHVNVQAFAGMELVRPSDLKKLEIQFRT